MSLDIVEMRDFYMSPRGRAARGALRGALARLWPCVRGERILAMGYATPVLRPWLGQAARLWAAMPAEQGAAFWPREGPNISVLTDLERLPFADEAASRLVLLHALEAVRDPGAVLREAWRVLAPGGRLIAIVPNRRGFWAHSETTPFGSGTPYSSRQLRRLLGEQGFLVERVAGALYAPPWMMMLGGRGGLRLAAWIERLAGAVCPALGGVHVVEAAKQLYRPALTQNRVRGRRLIVPMPFPAAPAGSVGAGRNGPFES